MSCRVQINDSIRIETDGTIGIREREFSLEF